MGVGAGFLHQRLRVSQGRHGLRPGIPTDRDGLGAIGGLNDLIAAPFLDKELDQCCGVAVEDQDAMAPLKHKACSNSDGAFSDAGGTPVSQAMGRRWEMARLHGSGVISSRPAKAWR